MTVYPRRMPLPAPRGNNSFATMVVVSLLLHLVLGVVVWRGVLPRREPLRPPAYLVDLVTLPTLTPGAPAAGKPRPVTPSTPAPRPVPAPPLKPALSKPAPASPVSSVPVAPATEDSPADVIKSLRARQAVERDIAALRRKDSRKPAPAPVAAPPRPVSAAEARPVAAPPVAPPAEGSDIGSDYRAWIKETLKAEWSYPAHLGARTDLQTTYEIVYRADGTIADYKPLVKSGDPAFDDSIRRAILRCLKKQPPQPLHRPFKQTVIFNLKELLAD